MRPSSAKPAAPRPSTAGARPSTATVAGRDAAVAAGGGAGAASRVTVGVRVRPVNAKFDPDGSKVVVTRDPLADLQLCVDDGKRGRTFAYDHVFTTTQDSVYVALGRPMLDEAYKGFNVCLFAYGQTGSGKTHSIQGTVEDEGLVPRFVKDMFRCAQEKVEADPDLTVKVTMSYLEVYMEKVRDLLGPRTRGQEPENLELIDVKGRVVAKGASVHSVLGADRVAELLEIGNANRQVAETKMNEVSSRSHSIVQFTLSQLHESVDRRDTESTVTIVDLAGSERQGKTESSGLQFEEAKKINQSLLVLGRALNSFSDARGDMVSLRDSKLTRLLSECFGGNAKTWMLATVAPTAFNVTETLSTLEYATHAKSITNKVTINALQRHAQLLELRDIVAKLNATVDLERMELDNLEAEVQRLEQENSDMEATLVAHRDSSNSAIENLLRAEIQRIDELKREIEIQQIAACGSSANVPPKRSVTKRPQYFAWAGLGLQQVIDRPIGNAMPFVCNLESAEPEAAGASIYGSLCRIDTDDHFLRWCLVIEEARDVPVPNGADLLFRLTFLLDPDCVYEANATARNGAASFVFEKKFYIPLHHESIESWCRSRDLMRLELCCR